MTTETLSLALPKQAGFVYRTFESDADYVHMAHIAAALSDAEHLDFYPTPEWLKSFFNGFDNFDPRRDLLIAENAANAEPIAFGRIARMEQLDGTRRYSLHARANPAWRAAELPMWRWFEARAREIDATLPPNSNTVLDTWAMEAQTHLRALLEGEGYAITRYGYEMARPLDDATPIVDFPMPEGFEIRPVKPEHYRAIWEADVEAFRDHNGFAEPGEARYQSWLTDPKFFQPELFRIAWHTDSNEVAGMVQNFIDHEENAKNNRKRGYTEGISTRRPFRKRGLARAIITISLRMFKDLGMTEAALGVDATNPTGALRVYEDCGFKPVKTEFVYQKRLMNRD